MVTTVRLDEAELASRVAAVEIVVPVSNAEASLESSIRRLQAYVLQTLPTTWAITIVDHGSTDGTWRVAQRLSCCLDGVRAIHLEEKGRAEALRVARSRSASLVVVPVAADTNLKLVGRRLLRAHRRVRPASPRAS